MFPAESDKHIFSVLFLMTMFVVPFPKTCFLNYYRCPHLMLPKVYLLKGIQFKGIVLPETDPLIKLATVHYYKKNPDDLAMPGEIWMIQIDSIKMTDSTFGFGKKITWKREAGIFQ